MFCVECGREPEELYDGLCEDCYLENEVSADLEDHIEIETCSVCSSVRQGDKWIQRPDIYSIMLDRIDEAISTSHRVDRYSFDADFEEKDRKNVEAEVEIKLLSKGLVKREKYTTHITFKMEQCETCSRIKGNYYEAILQVRPTSDQMSEEEKDIVIKEVDKRIEGKRGDERNIFLTSWEERHGGLDFYISDRGVTKRLANDVRDQLGGKITVSGELAGREDGQDVYRMTYSIRLPPYGRGDFLLYEDEVYRVKENRAKNGNVLLQEVQSGRKVSLEENKLEDVAVLGGDELVRDAVVVSETEEEIKVLDPDDYETKTLVKPEDYSGDEEEIKVVKIEKRLLVLPEE